MHNYAHELYVGGRSSGLSCHRVMSWMSLYFFFVQELYRRSIQITINCKSEDYDTKNNLLSYKLIREDRPTCEMMLWQMSSDNLPKHKP